MQPTKNVAKPQKIKGLSIIGGEGYGFKYRYLPPFYGFEQGRAGTIEAVRPINHDLWEPEELHDNPEMVEKATRAMFIKKLEDLIAVRDKHNMWRSSLDPREVMVDGLRLLKAGIDLDAPKILKALDTLPPMR